MTSPPEWFDVSRYPRKVVLDFEGWKNQIYVRVVLGQLLNAGKTEEFDQLFDLLKTDPLSQDVKTSGTTNVLNVDLGSDNPVHPLTFGVANEIVKVLTDHNCGEAEVCDGKLQSINPNSFPRQAHLFVNLAAPKSDIQKGFEIWLDAALAENRKKFPRKREARMSKAVTDKWAVSQILPYQDLRLWFKRQGQQCPSDQTFLNWLDLPRSVTSEAVREIRNMADNAFTLNTIHDLIFAKGLTAV